MARSSTRQMAQNYSNFHNYQSLSYDSDVDKIFMRSSRLNGDDVMETTAQQRRVGLVTISAMISILGITLYFGFIAKTSEIGTSNLSTLKGQYPLAVSFKTTQPGALNFTLSSPSFVSGEELPAMYGCKAMLGNGIPPPLKWSAAPIGTIDYLLTMSLNGVYKWGMYDIPIGSEQWSYSQYVEVPNKLRKRTNTTTTTSTTTDHSASDDQVKQNNNIATLDQPDVVMTRHFPQIVLKYEEPCSVSGEHSEYIFTIYAFSKSISSVLMEEKSKQSSQSSLSSQSSVLALSVGGNDDVMLKKGSTDSTGSGTEKKGDKESPSQSATITVKEGEGEGESDKRIDKESQSHTTTDTNTNTNTNTDTKTDTNKDTIIVATVTGEVKENTKEKKIMGKEEERDANKNTNKDTRIRKRNPPIAFLGTKKGKEKGEMKTGTNTEKEEVTGKGDEIENFIGKETENETKIEVLKGKDKESEKESKKGRGEENAAVSGDEIVKVIDIPSDTPPTPRFSPPSLPPSSSQSDTPLLPPTTPSSLPPSPTPPSVKTGDTSSLSPPPPLLSDTDAPPLPPLSLPTPSPLSVPPSLSSPLLSPPSPPILPSPPSIPTTTTSSSSSSSSSSSPPPPTPPSPTTTTTMIGDTESPPSPDTPPSPPTTPSTPTETTVITGGTPVTTTTNTAPVTTTTGGTSTNTATTTGTSHAAAPTTEATKADATSSTTAMPSTNTETVSTAAVALSVTRILELMKDSMIGSATLVAVLGPSLPSS